MDGSNWPIVVIEIVLVFGGVLAFGWWQLQDLDRERAKRTNAAERQDANFTDEQTPPP